MASNAKRALLCAYTLARAKQYSEAEALLLSDDELSKTSEAIDLLARMRMEEGDVAEARRLWQSIVTVDPNYKPAIVALKLMDRKPICISRKTILCGLLTFVFLLGVLVAAVIPWKASENAPLATFSWERIPTRAMLSELSPYKGKATRVCLSAHFFADPTRVAQRAILTDVLAETLGLPKTAIFIGEAPVAMEENALAVELWRDSIREEPSVAESVQP